MPLVVEGAQRIAERSRGTPRIANRLLRRARDYAQVKGDGTITAAMAAAALDLLEVDPLGFDLLDRKLLMTIIDKFDGGRSVSIVSPQPSVKSEATLEDVIEPFLIQQGFLMRTARGRTALAMRICTLVSRHPPDHRQRCLCLVKMHEPLVR